MRVLLIEDDPTTAKAIELMLGAEGFNVYTTDLGEEGLDHPGGDSRHATGLVLPAVLQGSGGIEAVTLASLPLGMDRAHGMTPVILQDADGTVVFESTDPAEKSEPTDAKDQAEARLSAERCECSERQEVVTGQP